MTTEFPGVRAYNPCYDNESQLRWTDTQESIVFRMIYDGKRGVPLTSDNVGAFDILLHSISQQAAPGLYAVKCDENDKFVPPGSHFRCNTQT